MLKLYTDMKFLTETHRRDVFPLLFDLVYKKNEDLLQYYQLVDAITESDIVVFPIDYVKFLKFKPEFSNLQYLARKHNKQIWIHTAGDYGFTNYIKNSYTFRLSGFDSKLSDSTYIMPSFINDPYLVQLSKGFTVIKKEVKPSIGFVGHAQLGFSKYLKEYFSYLKCVIKRNLNLLIADKQSFYPSSIKRANYLIKFKLVKELNTNFILRGNYRAGVQTEIDKQKTTQEFYDNIFDNAYTFCSRGVGNFSVRFYETLAVGRIPILLNTDCRLPLSNSIDWTSHCLILEASKKESLITQILDFHNSKSVQEFEDIQKKNRLLWKNKLMRHSFFINIHDLFLKHNFKNG